MINKGCHSFNRTDAEHKTIIIMGVGKSGTSMIAKVVQTLGVNMGDNTKSIVLERKDIYESLENNQLNKFKQLVEKENTKNKLWGWKRPKSIEYVETFEPLVRNPHYIIPFRDYIAIASRNQMDTGLNIRENIMNTHIEKYSKVISFISKNKKPLFVFSYEKSLSNRRYFVEQVANFIGISDIEKIDQAIREISPNNGKYINKNRLIGHFDKVANNVVHGWAKKLNLEKKLDLILYVNGVKRKKIKANKKRSDLSKYGDHAFSASLTSLSLTPGVKYEIDIKSIDGESLKDSPKTYQPI